MNSVRLRKQEWLANATEFVSSRAELLPTLNSDLCSSN